MIEARARREAQKHRYQLYRERAKALYERKAKAFSVQVPYYANVQECEGGAYVDAIVWVPSYALVGHEQGAAKRAKRRPGVRKRSNKRDRRKKR